MTAPPEIQLGDLDPCFEGAIPAVVATADAAGVPNVTYLSRVTRIDDERVALSNQFFSKTARNLVDNPRASVIVIDPLTYEQYRLTLAYERTDRRGPVYERLRQEVDIVAALQGMQSVFRLRAADVYRVVDVERIISDCHRRGLPVPEPARRNGLDAARISELNARLGRCSDLDTLVDCALDGLADLFGYDHAVLFLLDPVEQRLFTIASRGYPAGGIGAELPIGIGLPGFVAARATPIRVNHARQVAKYARAVRQAFDERAGGGPGGEIPLPDLADVRSQVAVPVMAMGALEGVLLVEDQAMMAFTDADEAVLGVIASILGAAVPTARAIDQAEDSSGSAAPAPGADRDGPAQQGASTHVRCYAVDGSVFVDGDYVIKGVAGRILASLLRQHRDEGRTTFTSKEVRLDQTLQLPSFRDNFDSRLLLLKRRLEDRSVPVRIEKHGRGRFGLVLDRPVILEEMPD